jgi:hypothetical protein
MLPIGACVSAILRITEHASAVFSAATEATRAARPNRNQFSKVQ